MNENIYSESSGFTLFIKKYRFPIIAAVAVLVCAAVILVVSLMPKGKKAPDDLPIESQPESSSVLSSSESHVSEEPSVMSSVISEVSSYKSIPSSSSSSKESLPESSADKPSDPVVSQRKEFSVTIAEGYTFSQIAKLLESKGVCTAKDFYDAAQGYDVQSFSVPKSSERCYRYEGYLFPDTYKFYENDDPEAVLKKMLNVYASKSGKPSDEILIIASIIEREARTDKNMKLVASVIRNRLDKSIMLKCDSTREYVNNHITGNKLLSDTSKYAALYNTYKCAALPAGPICNPSKRAINAALNPTPSEYLYFFYGNDNENHYAITGEEHEAQKEEFGVQFAK